ncbi:hypothetical protein VTJ83DRAFT_5160 [Remersonia thermophila]|uniref:Ig-like domain-containing protein n=1 Tax=Remersonia thermophila TaxID=72144 RepID=A0ABR4DC30_9PEZI
MGRRFLSAAALAVTVLAPAPAASQVTAGCTSNSFTIPSWIVHDFASYATSNLTVTSFDAVNRATNVALEFRCLSSDSKDGWHSCSARNRTDPTLPYTVAVRPEGTTAEFRFNETWSCSDIRASSPITFTAAGSGATPLTCADASGGVTCRAPKPAFIQASLSQPVSITPKYVSGPPNHREPGCTASSGNTTWEVVATQMIVQASTATYPRGSAFVIFRNDYLGYNAICTGQYTGTAEPAALSCSGQTAIRRPDKYQVQSSAAYDPVTHEFTVNQTWFCDDEDPAEPLAITALAATRLDLDCDQLDESTVFCSGGSPPFSGTVAKRDRLPPYSLNDPLSTFSSCTIASVAAPAWWLSSFRTSAAAGQDRSVTARFGMELVTGTTSGTRPTGYGAHIVAHDVPVPPAGENVTPEELPWNTCEIEAAGDWSLAPTDCEFKYQESSRYLGVRVGWTCSDLDPSNPISFRGELRTLAPALTCVTATNGEIHCTPEDTQPWRVNASSLTWE